MAHTRGSGHGYSPKGERPEPTEAPPHSSPPGSQGDPTAKRHAKNAALQKKQERHIHYPPIPNGIDYLREVVDRLAAPREPDLRDLKYAVLHLQAAAEVLLKARLRREHWSLVISKAEKTKREDFEAGSFDSASNHEVLRRLADVVGLDISKEDKATLLALAKTRNQLQHWGLTEEANAVLTRAADVLDFLIRFLDEHLLPGLDADDEEAVTEDLEVIRTGLTDIGSYVTSRMKRLEESGLKEHEALTVRCPDCQLYALVVDGITNNCLFCPRSWPDPEELARAHDNVFGNFPAPGDPWEATLTECPDCNSWTLALEAETAASNGVPVALCFNCGEVKNSAMEQCLRCGTLYRPVDTETVCSSCFDDVAGRR
ncbi:hypothetical protein ACOZDF_23345 [Streptomyces griseoincarnatus]